jgi:predicted enzyme related to lactoylglutathione lyase
MGFTHLQVVSVPVADQDRAKQFYMDVLGFELLNDQTMGPEMRWVHLTPPGAQTSITLVTWFPSMPPGSLKGIVIETDDVDQAFTHLQSKGVNPSPIEEAPWGRYTTFDDPDGNGWVAQARPG